MQCAHPKFSLSLAPYLELSVKPVRPGDQVNLLYLGNVACNCTGPGSTKIIKNEVPC